MDRATEEALAAAVDYEVGDDDGVDPDGTPPRCTSPPPKRKARKATKAKKVYTTADTVDSSDDVPGFDDYDDEDAFAVSPNLLDGSDTEGDEEDEEDHMSSSADEDIEDDEVTRETSILLSAAASAGGTVELTLPNAANPIEVETKRVLYKGDAQRMKPNAVVKELVPGQIAHIQLDDETFVHAVAIVDPKTSVVSYRGLTYAEEQTVIRNGLSDKFPKKIDYAALVKEQCRWDDNMTDSDTLTAAVAHKWSGFFRTHKLVGMERKRAFILSTEFIKYDLFSPFFY